MAKYTHSKVLTETVDNAVGYIHALVLVSKWDADKATEAAKNRYQLDVITMAVVSLKYKASVVDFIDPTVPAQKAIAQYTIDQIEAHKAEHKETQSSIVQPNPVPFGNLTNQEAMAQVEAKKEAKPVAAKKATK